MSADPQQAQVQRQQDYPGVRFRVGLWWTLASGISMCVAALMGLLLIPQAGIRKHLVGDEIGTHLIGFMLSLGASLAVAQWWVLRLVARHAKVSRGALAWWLPVTAIAFTAMVVPLYNVDFGGLIPIPSPVEVGFAILPGLLMLSVGQWVVLAVTLGVRASWIPCTCLGVTAGMGVGYMASSLGENGPVWALVTGLIMGLCQVRPLGEVLAGHRPQNGSHVRSPEDREAAGLGGPNPPAAGADSESRGDFGSH